MEKTGVALWIESHLWQIIAAAFAGFSAYLIGTTTDGLRLTALEARADKIETRLDALAPRVERLDALNEARMENGK